MKAVVLGAGGVFGGRVARELRRERPDLALVLAGRAPGPLEKLAAQLTCAKAHVAEAIDEASIRGLIEGAQLLINCAGPFFDAAPVAAKACGKAGVSYVDLADAPGYYRAVAELGPLFAAQGACVTSGASVLPALDVALALEAVDALEKVSAIGSAFFVGNDNPKGRAGISSLMRQPRELRAERSGRDTALPLLSEGVPLEFPFGERMTYRIAAPDYDVWAQRAPGADVDVRVAFERPIAISGLRLMRALRAPAPFVRIGSPLAGRTGTSGAAVRTEVRGFFAGRPVRAVGFAWRADEGQSLGSLPAVALSLAMLDRTATPGFVPPYELPAPGGLLGFLASRGVRIEKPAILPA